MLIKKLNINKRVFRIISLCLVFSMMFGLCLSSIKQINAKEKYQVIKIKEELLVMREGDQYKLNLIGYKDRKMSGVKLKEIDGISNAKWKSSNSNIVTVNSKGVVSAKKSGKCTITAIWGKKKVMSKIRVFTENEQYQYMIDEERIHEPLYIMLTTNQYRKYEDFINDNGIHSNITMEGQLKAANKIKEIFACTITEGMNDYEKVMAIAAWIIENIELDNDFIGEYRKDLEGKGEGRKDFFYMDPILYGKGSSTGIAYMFELLLNINGIRCDTSNIRNIVEMEGEYYYFNIMALAEDMKAYRDAGEKKKFFDLIRPGTHFYYCFMEAIYHDKEYDKKEYDDYIVPRDKVRIPLGYNTEQLSGMSFYYYDFYNNTIRFVTLKEEQKKDPCPDTYFSSYSIYPDFIATKYKEVLKELADKNEMMMVDDIEKE